MDALRVASVESTPYILGKTPLKDLLVAGAAVQNVQTAFVQAYAANGGLPRADLEDPARRQEPRQGGSHDAEHRVERR